MNSETIKTGLTVVSCLISGNALMVMKQRRDSAKLLTSDFPSSRENDKEICRTIEKEGLLQPGWKQYFIPYWFGYHGHARVKELVGQHKNDLLGSTSGDISVQ